MAKKRKFKILFPEGIKILDSKQLAEMKSVPSNKPGVIYGRLVKASEREPNEQRRPAALYKSLMKEKKTYTVTGKKVIPGPVKIVFYGYSNMFLGKLNKWVKHRPIECTYI